MLDGFWTAKRSRWGGQPTQPKRLFEESDLVALYAALGLTPAEQAEYLEAAREEQARQARNAARRRGELQDAWEPGPPADWAHDGTELRGRQVPGYECLTCRDTRWLKPRDIEGNWGTRKPIPCACLHEHPQVRARAIDERLANSGLLPELRVMTLERFRRRKGTHAALAAAKHFLHELERGGRPWLVLYGAPGTGKSHLVVAVTQRIATTQRVLWAMLPELLRRCQQTGVVDGQAVPFAADERITRAATEAPVLVLDEFGAAGANDWAREKLERIIDQRYMAERPTVLAVTVLAQELAEWSPRIASRLSCEHVQTARLTCTDYRAERTAE